MTRTRESAAWSRAEGGPDTEPSEEDSLNGLSVIVRSLRGAAGGTVISAAREDLTALDRSDLASYAGVARASIELPAVGIPAASR